ncbi:MAG: PQQ-binding-like beta-propeller repeat protein [Eubacteriales bacterium]|nr:PQQ-binding-like beta-propeller repeat protein [Eubacteriales bacterium]
MKKRKSDKRILLRITLFILISMFIVFFLIWVFKYGLFGIIKNTTETDITSKPTITTTTTSSPPTESETAPTTTEPVPTTTEAFTEKHVVAECLPENFSGYSYQIISGGNIISEYEREHKIYFEPSDEYTSLKGITAFRGNNYRDTSQYGLLDDIEGKLEIAWQKTNGNIIDNTGYNWTGVGWTGQASIVEWDDDLKQMMNIFDDKKQKDDLTEVIYATLDGKIYFYDLEDGEQTRTPINVGYPHKGSVSIDPRGIPLLYAGQGVGSIKSGGKIVDGPFGFRIFSLIDSKQLMFINGYDSYAYRAWAGFDGSSIVDAETDTLFQVGENGILYVVNLNTQYDPVAGSISIDPETIRFRYKSPYNARVGIESSPVAFRNYLYFADNTGLLQCIDVNTLKPVWVRNISDDTDSSLMIEEVGVNEAYVYTACEVDLQGAGGSSFIRKINAFTGELIWEYPVRCYFNDYSNGGALSAPVLGKNDIDDLVIFNIAKVTEYGNGNSGRMIAFDRKTGEVVWSVDLDFYCWSSPVDIYTKNGKSYLLVCDSGGYMRLFEGISGKEISKISLGTNMEGSPVVYNDMAVIGTRGQMIYGIRIR